MRKLDIAVKTASLRAALRNFSGSDRPEAAKIGLRSALAPVEHPFGSIKQWMHQGAFLMRGLANVRAEFSLTTLAYNLRRALNILGVEAMTAAVMA